MGPPRRPALPRPPSPSGEALAHTRGGGRLRLRPRAEGAGRGRGRAPGPRAGTTAVDRRAPRPTRLGDRVSARRDRRRGGARVRARANKREGKKKRGGRDGERERERELEGRPTPRDREREREAIRVARYARDPLSLRRRAISGRGAGPGDGLGRVARPQPLPRRLRGCRLLAATCT